MAEFTAAQKRAIETTDRTLLVSAAAGSGKTTTLIERIIRSVCDGEHPVPLDRLLIVTFTKAAASELRLRISRALAESLRKDGSNTFLARQMTLLPSAKICTIDSYCLDLLRANYTQIGLSPGFRVADDGEAALIARETMERLIDSCYDDTNNTLCGGAESFAALVNSLVGSRDDKSITDLFLSLESTLSSYPKGASALIDCADKLFSSAKSELFDTSLGKFIHDDLYEMLSFHHDEYENAIKLIEEDEVLEECYGPAFDSDFTSILRIILATFVKFSDVVTALSEITFPSLKPVKSGTADEEAQLYVKEVREAFKTQVKKKVALYGNLDLASVIKSISDTAEICKKIGELLCEYEKRATAEKQRRNVCDFSDISRYALRLLTDESDNDTPFALSLKSAYDAIYIDEYQDVNAVQDRIFRAISNESNRFMVGDIKQSIYAFRGAEPAIFSALRREYPDLKKSSKEKCAALFMSENFRCNREIIDFSNLLFDNLMPKISPNMNYNEKDSLVYAKKNISDAKTPVKIVLAENPRKGSPNEDEDVEAEYIATEILRLVSEGVPKDDGTGICFGDIAILLRAMKGNSDKISAVLRSHGIPVYSDTSENLLLQSEVQIVRCLLGAVDNPRRDVCVAGAMLSPLYGLDCEFIARIRAGVNDERLYTSLKQYLNDENSARDENFSKAKRFYNDLCAFRAKARFMSAGELMYEIYSSLHIMPRLGGNDALKRANLDKFMNTARSFAGGTFKSLSDFLRYIRSVDKDAKSPITAAKPQNTGLGAVRIMSIHQSKGLEYPVVFLAKADKRYRLEDNKTSVLYNKNAGFGMLLRDKSGFGVYDNINHRAVLMQVNEKIKEEELRLLYVALTRAKERLYITATATNFTKLLYKMSLLSTGVSVYAAKSCTSFLDLVLYSTAKAPRDFYTREIVFASKAHDKDKSENTDVIEEAETDNKNDLPFSESADALQKQFNFVYPHTARTKIPAKFSVSLLYPGIIDDEVSEIGVDFLRKPKLVRAPAFLSGGQDSAAKRGTATHLFMQFFDFDSAEKFGAAAEADRLCSLGFITAEDRKLVNTAEADAFIKSPLFAKMRAAKKIYREQRFNLTLAAADFAADESLKKELANEKIAVQGVIDCFFYDDDGRIILVDYKTDRVSGNREAAKQELRNRHSPQLSYYKKAIEQICGQAPSETLLYSLCLGEAIKM